ncbi:MAG: hypothetical protein IKP09_00705 [Lentisphaeria bacterium]|nr:hypothetical protein [Lentisphaeria bacterium]
MKKQQIISITGISFVAALFLGEGCCCPRFPIEEILFIAAIEDLFDWIGSNIGTIFLIIVLGGVIGVVSEYVFGSIIGWIVSFFDKK